MKPCQVVAAVISSEAGTLLLSQRPAHKEWGGYWELPGGKVEPGENFATALKRELLEELCLEVEVGACLGVYQSQHHNNEIELHVFIVKPLSEPRKTAEVQAWRWWSLRDLDLTLLPPMDQQALSDLANKARAN